MHGLPCRLIVRLALAWACAACGRPSAPAPAPDPHWLGTWAASQQLTEPQNMPPAPGLEGSTLRQVIHISVGGPTVRVRFSNTFGTSPLTLTSAHIARSQGRSAIDVTSDRPLMFVGADSVRIAPGAMATSDPLEYDVPALSDLAVTMHIGAAPADVTGHPGSRTTSFLQAGDRVSSAELPDAATADHWYVIAGLDVVAEGAAVVALGNSITDGRGSGTNQNDRWPDNLARRLQSDPRTRHVAVLNAGIGGNAVVTGGAGPTALSRLERDVLSQTGARWVILLEGVNDIGGASEPGAAAVARSLQVAYRTIIDRVHARGLRIFGATMPPFGGSEYDGPEREAARQSVNQWIRESGAFDAVIDFDAVLRDPAAPSRLLAWTDTGDHLHPNQAGYRLMADAVDLTLFVP
jgi:lysophospholipase L1-like esterase